MATDPNKTVFISYRRKVSSDRAALISYYLRQHGYNVFLDVETIGSGPLDSAILKQIGARAHFVVLIANGALERCQHEGDWVRKEIEEALRLKRNIVPIIDEGMNFDQEMAYLPDEWREQFKSMSSLLWSHSQFDSVLHKLVERFLIPCVPPVEIFPISDNEQRKNVTPYTTSLEIMPQPFDWKDIPAGNVTLTYIGGYLTERFTYNISTFQMAKYPITNAQFDMFITHSDGYKDSQWWDFSEDAQKWRVENTQPKPKFPDGDTYPRVNVCWYEAVAFCRWLSAITGENIMLPTEQQWQRAAQGDDGRKYPWGNEWSKTRCNNWGSIRNWRGKEIGKRSPTPVTQYEGRGDSPFGVVDMAGNVWERCLTVYEYEIDKTDLLGVDDRVFRGGSFKHQELDLFRTFNREPDKPYKRTDDVGFRIARLP